MILNLFFNFFIFMFGLAVGSFLNCIIYRLAPHHFYSKSGGGLFGRSFCPHCKHQLSWRDLIPVLSFLILKGKCRYCKKSISLQYPLVELATGFLFVSIFNFLPHQIFEGGSNQFSVFNFQNLLSIIYYLLIICFLIIIFVYDLKHYIIPDKVIYPAIAIALIFNFLPHQIFEGGSNQFSSFQFSILSAFMASAFFLSIVLVSRGKWMGLGDVKLAFLMGLFLGWPNILVALFLAFSIGAIIGIGLIVLGKKSLKSEVPFGPFLVTGTFIALFLGGKIINWYLNILTI